MLKRLLRAKPSYELNRRRLKTSVELHEKILERRGRGNLKESYKIYGRAKSMASKRVTKDFISI